MFTALKTFSMFGLEFSVAMIAYPVTYIFSDIFTEVYGYRVTRKIVWSGFGAVFLVSLFAYIYSIVPPSSDFASDDAFKLIFQSAPPVIIAQIVSFFAGELTNSIIFSSLLLCVTTETLMTPIIHRFIRYIKKVVGIDTYDVGTNFNPFKLK